MAAISSRGSRRRRTINEINMVPFIDVMLVLLIIFMVSAPLITTGVVDLPSVGRSRAQPEHVIHVIVGPDEKLKLKVDKEEPAAITLKQVADKVRTAQAGEASTPVVISADKSVKYEAVVKVMDVLQSAGVQRVGLAVRNGGGSADGERKAP
ncbi:protein TolR [Roseateles koreensis]|uniref:Protein TolR n=1 Tax=Roseateles koreensis TaxID=2987526 RepID=A0ABT5KNN5_9BURK|nr:protein TolR [Roseateles koreensis]MDC8784467.1 protein TolR [Roseateles koreensis]